MCPAALGCPARLYVVVEGLVVVGVLNSAAFPLPPFCPPTPPRSRLSEAGDRRRVGLYGWTGVGGVAGAVWRVEVKGQAHGPCHHTLYTSAVSRFHLPPPPPVM